MTGVLLCHSGTQHSFSLARQLERVGCLSQFWTGLAFANESSFVRTLVNISPVGMRRTIANRMVDGVPRGKLKLKPWIELAALSRQYFGEKDERIFLERNRRFQEALPARAIRTADAVIGFDTAGWLLAERALAVGKPFILDRSQAHVKVYDRVLEKLTGEFSDWQIERNKRPTDLYNLEEREFELAESIVVASSFSRNTLIAEGVSQEKIIINPYGVDLEAFKPPTRREEKEGISFLYVGTLSIRKGLPLLLKVWPSLNRRGSELTLAGPVDLQTRRRIPDLDGLKVLGKFPHRDLPEIFRAHDVFVFPSYFDGFGLVILEAMASGLPVITTDATAGPDLIENGVQGFVIPAGDSDSLTDTMQFFIENPEQIFTMGAAARKRAEQYSWDSYGERWRQILKEIGIC